MARIRHVSEQREASTILEKMKRKNRAIPLILRSLFHSPQKGSQFNPL
jgi:hypothetical protein